MIDFVAAANYSYTQTVVHNSYFNCALVIAIGLLVTYGGIGRLVRRAIFRKKGVWVEGEVTKIVELAGTDNQPVYYPVITYTTLENEIITTHYDAVHRRPSLYSVNDKVIVIYDPKDKREIIINDGSGEKLGWVLAVFGLLMLLYGCMILRTFL
ncbi:DUF3592 domain-containing protein [Mucilaginibacter psychrotolerans]|uniref:DUF3592 domain-containing protein n=1 Tax=Mucilaginibacter psychrotolerans TaxID=1524096 RepID=A0A4Y8SFT0_9SPHI|nr:DUF3592 domain-containing protein [Mucilaginibacter psychrotolerans]TFF37304.1 DUF3592 domain-containing protein [Mucilaginibacter psychrotolerans]